MVTFLVLYYGILVDLTVLITSLIGLFISANKLTQFFFLSGLVLQIILFELRKNYFLDKVDEEIYKHEPDITLTVQIIWILGMLLGVLL